MPAQLKSDVVDSPMAKLLAEEQATTIPKVGDVVHGRVLSVSKNEVHLDIDGLTTGVVRGRELYDESGEFSNLTKGEEASATVLELENENGEMELSFRQAGHRKAWAELERMFSDHEVVDALVTDANRGGLMIKLGRVVGFLPVSQLSTEHYPRVEGGDKNKILEILTTFVGQKFRVKIIDLNEQEDKLIVSEKAAMEEKQKELLSAYHVDDVVDGVVTGVVDFGAFVEFGPNLEGLVHISELAWQRVEDPRQYVKVGEKVQAKIIAIEGTKISLSIKRLSEDPWKIAVERYDVGQSVEGTVRKINSFGAFVELDEQIHGLAHISELADRMVRDPHEVVETGNRYTFRILAIDAKSHRLGLSLKKRKQPGEQKNVPEKKEKAGSSDAETKETAEPVSTTTPDTQSSAEKTSPSIDAQAP